MQLGPKFQELHMPLSAAYSNEKEDHVLKKDINLKLKTNVTNSQG